MGQLGQRAWLAYYVGLGVLFAADAMLLAAVIWTAYRLGGSAVWISLGAVTLTGPVIVAGVGGAGVAARHVGRLSAFAWTGGLAALAIAVGVGVLGGSVWWLLAMALTAGLAQALRLPLGQAQMMESASGEEIARRATFYEAASRGGVVAGPIIAGVLLALGGPVAAFSAVAAAYLTGGVLWSLLATDRLPVPDQAEPYALAHGIRLVQADAWLLPALGVRAAGNLLWPAFTIALPLLVALDWHGGAVGYGLARSVWGGGTVLATSLLVWLPVARERRQWAFFLCWVGTGVGFMLIGAAPGLLLGLLAVGFTALGSPLMHIAVDSHIAERVPRHWRGDLYALQRLVVNGVQTIGLLALVPVANLLNPGRLLVLTGAAIVLVAVLGWRWMDGRRGPAWEGGVLARSGEEGR